jgi:hypothetical protein
MAEVKDAQSRHTPALPQHHELYARRRFSGTDDQNRQARHNDTNLQASQQASCRLVGTGNETIPVPARSGVFDFLAF